MKIKKIITSIMVLGVISTMGVNAFADTNIGNTSNIYYCGDVNLDGKVNVLDLLSLKKMVLGIAPLTQMYIDNNGSLKQVSTIVDRMGMNMVGFVSYDSENNQVTFNCSGYKNHIGEQLGYVTLDINDDTAFYNINDVNDLCSNESYYVEYIEYSDGTRVATVIQAYVDMYDENGNILPAKPVIYLYPTEETEVNVTLNFNGDLTCTYPKYENGWSVIAEPDGTLYDKDGNEYYCLYWEGSQNVKYDTSKGFVVKGEDTADFLREKLLYMGLTPKETQEFIIYWLPKMENNPYNLITFQDDIYTENAKLDITPQPDSLLRIFMTYKPLETPIEVQEQELSTFDRSGFVAIEWGGAELN